MKILFCGDVVGKSGRTCLTRLLPELRKKLEYDVLIINGEVLDECIVKLPGENSFKFENKWRIGRGGILLSPFVG